MSLSKMLNVEELTDEEVDHLYYKLKGEYNTRHSRYGVGRMFYLDDDIPVWIVSSKRVGNTYRYVVRDAQKNFYENVAFSRLYAWENMGS